MRGLLAKVLLRKWYVVLLILIIGSGAVGYRIGLANNTLSEDMERRIQSLESGQTRQNRLNVPSISDSYGQIQREIEFQRLRNAVDYQSSEIRQLRDEADRQRFMFGP